MAEPGQTHADYDLLLPWYVNGTLDEALRGVVEEHIISCDECRNGVGELARIQQAVSGSRTTPLVPEPSTDRLMSRIEGYESMRHQLARAWPWAAAAAVGALLVTLFSFSPGSGDAPVYHTATSAGGAELSSYVLQIQLAKPVLEDERQLIFDDLHARVLNGDDQSLRYEVVIETSASSMAELDALVSDIVSHENVVSARVVAVQLPVREERPK